MKKILIYLFFICTYSFTFGQSYSLTVESQYGFKFYGDYSGVVYATSYTIGPYSSPFTVTLTPVANYRWTRCDSSLFPNGTATWEYKLKSWTVNDVTYNTTIQTVSVDTLQPSVKAVADWPLYLHGDGSTDYYVAWICNPAVFVFEGDAFSSTVYIRGGDVSTNFEIHLKYNPAIINPDTITQNSSTVEMDNTIPGLIRFTGSGISIASNVASITWKALKAGNGGFDLDIIKFEDDNGNPVTIGGRTPAAFNISAIVRKGYRMFGDIDEDNTVNIIDALMIARYTVGNTPVTYDQEVADVNLDGSCNIIDALIIAQYSVGLITSLPHI